MGTAIGEKVYEVTYEDKYGKVTTEQVREGRLSKYNQGSNKMIGEPVLVGQRQEVKSKYPGLRQTGYTVAPIGSPDQVVKDYRTAADIKAEQAGTTPNQVANRKDGTTESKQDIITDNVTGKKYVKNEQTGQYEPYTGQEQGGQGGDTITDPVTGKQYSRTSANETYQEVQAPGQVMGAQTSLSSGYTGPSIVDYLDSVGQASDFGSRSTLAKQYGIQNYTGTAEQNTQLLNTLRQRNPQQPIPTAPAPTGASAPVTGNYTGTQAPAPVSIDEVFKSYGVDLDIEGFMKNPVASFEDTYDKLYKNLGISDLKKEASKLLKQATDLDEEYADKITEINNDPWLTEGQRIARVRKEEERRDLKKAGVLNTLAIYDKNIDSLTDQARFLVQGTYDQYNADRNFTKDMIGVIYDRVDKANQAQIDLIEAMSSGDYKNVKEVQGGLYDLSSGNWIVPPKSTNTGSAGGAGNSAFPQTDQPYGSDGYYEQLFARTSGGTALTGEQTLPLTKASIVLNQVGELTQTIRSTNTDPILGILRDKNPYDVKARLIQAQLRSTVPNLARGVYGEVGVLTDTDIANYIQTLPNIKTPQQANELVLAMTLGTIRNSMRAYLESYANSGRNVSGFLPQYRAMNEKIDSLLTYDSAFADEYNSMKEQTTGGLLSWLKNIF